MKTVLPWALVALAAAATLGIAHEPAFWMRYAATVTHPGSSLPLSTFTPRELVAGGNQPPAPRVTPAAELLDPQALQASADYAAAHQSAALIVSRHGYIVFERYWRGSSFNSLTESGALGRVIAALVTGSALAERKIGWPDEPIGNFITEWRDDPRGAITVRNLLQLSSGLLPPDAGDGGNGLSRQALSSDLRSLYLRRPLGATPGKKWVEQSADPDLLALVIERATHQRYAHYVSQALWQRIGAADAWIWLDRPGGAAHVDHGFLVRQGDWIRVAELLLNNGNYQGDEVLAPRWIPQMLAPTAGNADYGAYLRLGAHAKPGMTPYATADVFVVEGSGNRLWLIPSLQISILCTGPRPGSPDWDDGRIPNLVIRGARDFVPPAARPGARSTLVPNH